MKQIPSYETAPYRKELEVEVLEVLRDGDRVYALLNDTLLYPEGGGQPCDRGWLSGVQVCDVLKQGGEIRHYLTGSDVAAGRSLLELDWVRRYDHMQQHTAQHLLSALSLSLFDWKTRAFHLGEDVSDIDLDVAEPSDEDVATLEEQVAAKIAAALRIRSQRVSLEEYRALDVRSRGLPADHCGDIRLVEIEGVDVNTCGGTHVGMTSEVGGVKILRMEPQRGGTRLPWVAGGRLRRRLARHEVRSAELRAVLDTGDNELVSVCRLKLEQLASERRQRRLLEERLVPEVVEDLLENPGSLVERHLDGVEAALLRRVSEEFRTSAGDRVAFLTCVMDDTALFALVQGERGVLDLRETGARVCEILGGRGGGSKLLFQGKARSLIRRPEALDLVERHLRDRV